MITMVLDGKAIEKSQANIALLSRPVMYGEGVFDTIRAYNGGFLYPERHLERLQRGISYLGMNVPNQLKSTQEFLNELKHFLEANDAMDQHVRIRTQVWRDDLTPGYRPGSSSARFVISGTPLNEQRPDESHAPETDATGKEAKSTGALESDTFGGETKSTGAPETDDSGGEPKETGVPETDASGREAQAIEAPETGTSGSEISTTSDAATESGANAASNEGVRLITSRYRRIPSDTLPSDVKWSHGINYILAARQAEQQQADDALMLTRDGFLSETTIANIFWKEDGTIYTPSAECDLLPGITRGMMIEMFDKAGIPLISGRFHPDVLRKADMVWACNSIKEIYPVLSIDAHRCKQDHDFWERLQELFQKQKLERLQYVR